MLSIQEHSMNFMSRKRVVRLTSPLKKGIIEYIEVKSRERLPAVQNDTYLGVDGSRIGWYDNANAFINKDKLIALEAVNG